jgi:FAD dependent oxidoreductase
MQHREIEADVCIVGGGTGGYAAALAVARSGRRCVVTEPTDWLGGQLTSQGVPPDENRWIEYEQGVPAATGSYLRFRDAVRTWYRENRPLTPTALANPRLNPGNGWVSHLCMEPTVAHAVLTQEIARFVEGGLVTVLLEHEPIRADVDADQVRSVTVSSHGDTITIRAAYFLDATELGDLLPLTRTSYRIGAEAKDEFGELHGHPTGDPNDQQSISWCFALEHCPGEDHTISKPARYDFFRDWVPQLSPAWPGKMLSWTVAGHDGSSPKTFPWKPWPQQPDEGELEMWRYRRIVDRSLYRDDVAHAFPDVALINMAQMDYLLQPILDVPNQAKDQALADAKQQSLSLLYWMQTEAPRFDGSDGVGFKGLKLRGNEMGTHDGFAKAPYIREARRLDAIFIVHEGHVGTEQRRQERRASQDASPYGMAEPFFDSVGVGHYRLDLHPSTGGRNTVYAQAAPFRIPLGSLIPKSTRNLLAAGKCLGVSHVANGAYRLHPIEWNIGEAAGELAVFCLEHRCEPAQVRERMPLLRDYQQALRRYEVPLAWPWERDAGLA